MHLFLRFRSHVTCSSGICHGQGPYFVLWPSAIRIFANFFLHYGDRSIDRLNHKYIHTQVHRLIVGMIGR